MKSGGRTHSGFSIVELLIVIAVVGIIAAITYVGYGAWQYSARTAQVKSDLTNAASAMENARTFNNEYPTDITTVFSASSGVTIAGGRDGGNPNAFCLDGSSDIDEAIIYYIDEAISKSGAVEGTCADRANEEPSWLLIDTESYELYAEWNSGTNQVWVNLSNPGTVGVSIPYHLYSCTGSSTCVPVNLVSETSANGTLHLVEETASEDDASGAYWLTPHVSGQTIRYQLVETATPGSYRGSNIVTVTVP